MYDYRESRFWKEALAPRSKDPHQEAREKLRAAFVSFRERAAVLAGEINQSLPEFTVHDITHIDSLWEMGLRAKVVGYAAAASNASCPSGGCQ
jgi:hypothetical protein